MRERVSRIGTIYAALNVEYRTQKEGKNLAEPNRDSRTCSASRFNVEPARRDAAAGQIHLDFRRRRPSRTRVINSASVFGIGPTQRGTPRAATRSDSAGAAAKSAPSFLTSSCLALASPRLAVSTPSREASESLRECFPFVLHGHVGPRDKFLCNDSYAARCMASLANSPSHSPLFRSQLFEYSSLIFTLINYIYHWFDEPFINVNYIKYIKLFLHIFRLE